LEESYDLFDVSVARMGNAVIAWTFDPNDEERAAVEDCLS
jgi:predicted GNAT superfamily acetyltransferase